MSADNLDKCPKCEKGAQDEGPLREDYELGFFDSKFYVIYRAKCRECGFKYHFDHEEILHVSTPVPDEPQTMEGTDPIDADHTGTSDGS